MKDEVMYCTVLGSTMVSPSEGEKGWKAFFAFDAHGMDGMDGKDHELQSH